MHTKPADHVRPDLDQVGRALSYSCLVIALVILPWSFPRELGCSAWEGGSRIIQYREGKCHPMDRPTLPPPPVNRITHEIENITFPRATYVISKFPWVVKISGVR